MLRNSILRAAGSTPSLSVRQGIRAGPSIVNQITTAQQCRNAHAISNPELASIEKRWEVMAPQEQAELWMKLRDRMKVDWHEMTMQEKKAAYWIAFGPHGPRSLPPPGEGTKIFYYTMLGVAASAALFGFARYFARPPPGTMNKEYQEQTDAYLKEQNVEPITGISADDWKGGFTVQSKPKGK